MRRAPLLLACGLLASVAAGFLVSNSPVGGRFVFENVPSNRQPVDVLVDTEGVPGVANPLAVTQDLMNQWNLIDEADDVFGVASLGGPYNGLTVGNTFGVFTNQQYEVAFDDTGSILGFFGVGPGVLGITLKSVDTGSGRLLDWLVVINTQGGALSAPGSGATTEQLLRSTLLHELGHALGIGHTPVGMVGTASFGFSPAPDARVPTMFPFRFISRPQEGGSLEADDIAALIDVYPDSPDGRGSISGTVRTLSGAPVNEIAVRAVGPEGVDEAHFGILTNVDGTEQGRYTIPSVLPGRYRVILEAVNGRASVDDIALAGGTDALGGNPFVFAADEHYEVADTYDPAFDDPADFALVTVRAGRDTSAIDFVLNAAPLVGGQPVAASLQGNDAQIPDAAGGFHFADYYVFAGVAGQTATLTATSVNLTPQLRVLRPTDMTVVASDLPLFGGTAGLAHTLQQTGAYTVIVSARSQTGNPGGTGGYNLSLQGSGGALPAPPATAGASVSRGLADPGAQQFGSPARNIATLQVRLQAPSHQELWVDSVTLRASGEGHDQLDLEEVTLLDDRNGNGLPDGGDATLAVAPGGFGFDDSTLTLGGLDVELVPGEVMNLLVVYDVSVQSVSSASFSPVWWVLPVLLALLALLRRSPLVVAALVVLALLPLACGGGGGGGGGPPPFNPAGAVVTFQTTVAPGDIEAFTPTSAPGAPLGLPAVAIVSGILSVSN